VCSKENQLIAYDKEADTTTTTSQYCSEKPISEEVGDTVNFFFPEQSEVVQYNKTTKAAVKASLSAQTATLKDGKLTYADGERIVRVSVEALLAPALSLAGDEEVLAEGVDAFTLAAGSDRVFFAGLDLTSGSFATGSVSSAGAVAKEEASEKVLEILEMKK
jgi:hypothetical protein